MSSCSAASRSLSPSGPGSHLWPASPRLRCLRFQRRRSSARPLRPSRQSGRNSYSCGSSRWQPRSGVWSSSSSLASPRRAASAALADLRLTHKRSLPRAAPPTGRGRTWRIFRAARADPPTGQRPCSRTSRDGFNVTMFGMTRPARSPHLPAATRAPLRTLPRDVSSPSRAQWAPASAAPRRHRSCCSCRVCGGSPWRATTPRSLMIPRTIPPMA